MRCAACSQDNLPGARFCSRCGGGLERICVGCGHASGSGAQFCSACGRSLALGVAAADDRAPASDLLVGERRHLTVLFCDIIGSTDLVARLDVEDWHAIDTSYQRCGAEAVERFGGVARFQGDGFLAYFGYPVVHGDSPERGTRAGIAILDALVLLNQRLERQYGVRLAVRIAIHTGDVVVGEGGGKDAELFGEAVHLAARLQQLAGPNEVLVTETTYRLVSGLFVMEERGSHVLRGIAKPVRLYRVLQPTGARGRLQASGVRELTPFVGREAERSLLLSRWQRAQEGEGQVVLVSGDPGIGKSRLVQVFRNDIAGHAQTWVEYATSSYHANTPFFCVIEMIQQGLSRQCGESPEERLVFLERALTASGLDPREGVPLLAGLIGLSLPPGRYPPIGGSPAHQRERLIATLAGWFLAAAAIQPAVLVVEDLMWADPSTIELLELLGRQAATARVLLLYTARPEFRCPWPPRSNLTIVTLNRLDRQHVREMIASRTHSALLELVETLVARSDGVPLFAEELTSLVTGAAGRFALGEVPATLQDLLAARLDRVGPARRIAQIGAAIGREFSYRLLEAIAGSTAADLGDALARLTDAELLHARGFPPDATYVFKHALIRDAAYGTLLKSRRRELHVAIARTLTDRFPDTVETMPELLAHHFTEAGEVETAWRQWQRAGELAVARSALREAAGHFTKALELLGTLPDAPGRVQQTLNLQVLLGQALAATKGYGARDVTDAFARARELARQAGGTPELLSVLFGLWTSIAGQGELGVARGLADELLVVAERAGMRTELVWGHLAHGVNHYSLGELTAARDHLARVVLLYREVERPPSPSDPGVMALSYATVNSWTLGLVDESRERSRESLELAQRLRNPLAVAWARFFTGALHVFLKEPGRALEHVEPLIALSTEHGFALFVALATIVRGAALTEDGRHEEGLVELGKGLDVYRTTGQRVSHRLYLCWLAQAYAAAGAVEEATATVDEALGMPTDERLFEPELHRLRAELLARQNGEPTHVEASFREAIELARRQAARSLELRASTSYARWLQIAGRGDEGREHLDQVCGWFSAASDTRDLEEARALLRQLTAGAQ
ncbi:MAG TPA: AAA family ATPase [Candidatus Binatia bacterium]|nr:AAA family ATPase [Candidatus Binatia bacterium]